MQTNEWKVGFLAVSGISLPDALMFFDKVANPILEVLVRLGQFGVTVVTIIYIVKKMKDIRRRREQEKC